MGKKKKFKKRIILKSPINGEVTNEKQVDEFITWWCQQENRMIPIKTMILDLQGKDLHDPANGQLRLIEMLIELPNNRASRDGTKFMIFDVMKLGYEVVQKLQVIFESNATKYMHGGLQKSLLLFRQFGIAIKNMKDTQKNIEVITGNENATLSEYIDFIDPALKFSSLEANEAILRDSYFWDSYNTLPDGIKIHAERVLIMLYKSVPKLEEILKDCHENKVKVHNNVLKQQHTFQQNLFSNQGLIFTMDDLQNFVKWWDKNGKDIKNMALDCEGVNLSSKGKLCLIQICFDHPKLPNKDGVFIFDISRLGKSAMKMLEPMLTSNTSKFIHDARMDVTAIWGQYGIKLNNVVDTQLIYEELTGKVYAGLNQFLNYIDPELSHDTKDKGRVIMKMEPTCWDKRPLRPLLLQYAREDVIKLNMAIPKINLDFAWNKILKKSWARKTRREATEIQFNEKSQLKPISALENEIIKCPPVIVYQEENKILFDHLPQAFLRKLNRDLDWANVREIILDRGKEPYAFFCNKKRRIFICLDRNYFVDDSLLQKASENLNFASDNRACIENSLHRVVNIKAPNGDICCLVFRFGRIMDNLVTFAEDILFSPENENKSILILGPPGTGKTSMIRAMAKELDKRNGENVIIVDTSNEICGGGETIHKSLGLCRRMIVRNKDDQSQVMIEAVQNLTPDTIVIDEIGTEKEVLAAQTIKYRGPRIIASAHGTFIDILRNPSLNQIYGHFETVTYGDLTIPKGSNGNKLQLKRTGIPIFDIVIELIPQKFNQWNIISDVGAAVDDILNANPIIKEVRSRDEEGNLFLDFIQENLKR